MARVLVTGASGYIGKRLVIALLKQGHEVYGQIRVKGVSPFGNESGNFKPVYADLAHHDSIENLPNDLDAAYYLMHSMSDSKKRFASIELTVAENFLKAIAKTSIRQVIYLSGIVPTKGPLSRHLASRHEVELRLNQGSVPCTTLRASIIIGSGSAPFEIIRDLVEKLPIMLAPKWIEHRCQPIAVSDVLYYLTRVLLQESCYNHSFDIGGPEVMSFKQVLLRYAALRDLKRTIISIPFITTRISSYWLVFMTSVRFSLASYLAESMNSDTICAQTEIRDLFPHTCLNYDQALRLALSKTEQNALLSTWMDSWDREDILPDLQQYLEVPSFGCLTNIQAVPLKAPVPQVIERVWSLGGDTGWLALNWAWSIRGKIDKLIGGVGLNRGRRHPTEITVGDAIDFWRVLKADHSRGHLILYAMMKVPGEAWLEFRVVNGQASPLLIQTATFRPKGVLGRLYWYVLAPFHFFIFRRMAKALAEG